MKIEIHSIHFDADEKLEAFIGSKMDKLDQYYDNIINGEVFLRLDKSDSNDNKIAEIKLKIPGNELFVKKQCKSFEEATDTAVEALRRQVKKHKEKLRKY
ncbi:MAG: ribosomal subunit interface protein [Crocinitomicaceae bacterium]|nr:ribosomal subunit interface protein [Crocinitomicaceae bacterium]|tara:strand:+ start:3492 stop:3791 length:300 start_codon:yes stop_codon:yes gene_type:complete